MKIWEQLRPEQIFLNVDLRNKEAVLRFVADAFARSGVVKNANRLFAGMESREAVLSTGIGNGIGIPHTSSAEVEGGAMLLVRLSAPIEFEALDALPVDIILALVVAAEETTLHLQILAGVARLCRNPRFLPLIREAADSHTLLDSIKELEEEKAFH